MFVPPGGSGITAVDCDRTFEFSSPVETFRATVKSVSWEHGEPMVRVVPTRDGVNECAGCGTHDETTRYGIATESTMGEVDLCDGCLEWLRGSDDGCSICTDDSSGHDSITEIADPDEAEHFPLCKECRMEADHGEHPIVHERARRRREQRDDDWGLE